MPRIPIKVTTFAPKAIAARLSEDLLDVLQEFGLKAVVVKCMPKVRAWLIAVQTICRTREAIESELR